MKGVGCRVSRVYDLERVVQGVMCGDWGKDLELGFRVEVLGVGCRA